LVVTMNGERFTPVNTFEYEALAKLKLPKMVYDYYASGADDEHESTSISKQEWFDSLLDELHATLQQL